MTFLRRICRPVACAVGVHSAPHQPMQGATVGVCPSCRKVVYYHGPSAYEPGGYPILPFLTFPNTPGALADERG